MTCSCGILLALRLFLGLLKLEGSRLIVEKISFEIQMIALVDLQGSYRIEKWRIGTQKGQGLSNVESWNSRILE